MNQRVFTVTKYIGDEFILTVQRNFRQEFNITVGSNVTSRSLNVDWYCKFHNFGNVLTTYTNNEKSVKTLKIIE